MLKTKEVLFGKAKVLCSLQKLCPMVDPGLRSGAMISYTSYCELSFYKGTDCMLRTGTNKLTKKL